MIDDRVFYAAAGIIIFVLGGVCGFGLAAALVCS